MSEYAWVCHVCGAGNDKSIKLCEKCASPMTMRWAEIEARKKPSQQLILEQPLQQSAGRKHGRPEIKPRIPMDAKLEKHFWRAILWGFAVALAALMARHYFFHSLIAVDTLIVWFFVVMVTAASLLFLVQNALNERIHRLIVSIAGGDGGSYFLRDQATATEVKLYLRMIRVSFWIVFFAAAASGMILSKIVAYSD